MTVLIIPCQIPISTLFQRRDDNLEKILRIDNIVEKWERLLLIISKTFFGNLLISIALRSFESLTAFHFY